MEKNLAFTLAEVLVTLAIIGIVAVLTISTINNNIQKRVLKVQLTKTHAMLTEVLQKMTFDEQHVINYEYVRHNLNSGGKYKEKFEKYMHVAVACWETPEGTCLSNITRPKEYKTYNNGEISTVRLDDGDFILNNGVFVMLESASGRLEITVDINGKDKGPNKWGHDLFTFQIMDNGIVLPMGASGTRSNLCDKKSNDGQNGVGCTYKALNDPDYFKNLP